jgi:hypothetical protein
MDVDVFERQFKPGSIEFTVASKRSKVVTLSPLDWFSSALYLDADGRFVEFNVNEKRWYVTNSFESRDNSEIVELTQRLKRMTRPQPRSKPNSIFRQFRNAVRYVWNNL